MDQEPDTVAGVGKPRTEGGHPVSEEVLGSTQDIDEAKVEAFAEQMLGVLNDAMLALMTSIGHQTGLFDTMADLPPSTSEEIASAAKLQERYVREWLGAMVVGGIVTYDPSGKTYRLPPEHAACLTRAAGPDNLANVAQFVAVARQRRGRYRPELPQRWRRALLRVHAFPGD